MCKDCNSYFEAMWCDSVGFMSHPVENAREKTKEAIELYANGERRPAALEKVGLSRIAFYRTIERNEDLKELWALAKKARAHGYLDEALSMIATETDARMIAAKTPVLKWAAAVEHPQEFSERQNLSIDHNAAPSLIEALQASKQRVALPLRDLGAVAQSQVVDVVHELLPAPRDTKSADAEIEAVRARLFDE